ncbi:MAG: DNA-directed RNA polymerase subunit H [Thermoplasmata archaeon]|nr:DNA-directed RNA polymerase subunit H [Thermoplasmata archaeon]
MEFNVLEHEMVPEHHLLSEKEEKKVLENYGIGKDQLPKIRKTDPCIKTLEEILGEEISEGRVIKVVRLNPVSGVSNAYRVVIRG